MEAVESAKVAPERGAGIAGLIAGALLGRLSRVTAIWPLELAGQLGEPVEVSAAHAERVVRATASALRSDDLQPLHELIDVDHPAAELGDRLDHVLACLDAVRRALMAVVETEEVDARIVSALARQAPTAFAQVARRLAHAALVSSTAALPTALLRHSDDLSVTVHELRRPLTIVSSYAQLLEAGGLGTLPGTAQPALRSIAEATDTMMRLVDDLATVARLGEPPVRPFERASVADLVRLAVTELLPAANLSSVTVEVDVDASLMMRAVREDVVLALANLLGNAITHAPAGSAVRVTAVAHDGRIRIGVSDRGPGFPAADAERLFEKYYRGPAEAERGVSGTGLGLFIVRAVAQRHGGSATAHPGEGGGAEFRLELPAA